VLKVRLTRKLADMINGIDLRKWRVGQIIDLPKRHASLLIAEGWAQLIERRRKAREPEGTNDKD
jgi:hypothetical protein